MPPRISLPCAWSALLAIAIAFPTSAAADSPTSEPTQVLIVVGPSNHPPGTHEVAAGAALLEYCLDQAENVDRLEATVVHGWPEENSLVARAATIVFFGDTFPPARLEQTDQIMKELAAAMDRGCGLVCIHYATGLRNEDVAIDGDHPLLRWTGGYFATRCKHHQSVARVLEATIVPAEEDHPVLRGWDEFTLIDEPYYNNYFGPDGPAANVTPIATSMLPPEDPQQHVVAWSVERPDGGRGMGIVMPHFFRSWKVDDLRTCIVNGVVWTAQREIPEEGVQTTLPEDLTIFSPAALEPQPRRR